MNNYLTDEQKIMLKSKLQQYKTDKVATGEIINTVEDILDLYIQDACTYADSLENLIDKFRSDVNRLNFENAKLKNK
jgi:hypothetical protein